MALTTLSVICPCYNESSVIREFYARLRAVLSTVEGLEYSIVFVDDGSTDGTLDLLNEIAGADENVEVYAFSRNFGHQVALSAGIDTAESDAVVLMDSDLQHPPEVILKMLDSFRQGFDVVYPVRRCTHGVGFLKRITSGGFYWLFNHLSETRVEPGAADFCLLSRRAYEALRSMPERHRFLRGMVAWLGFRRATLEYEACERFGGRPKYTFSRMLRLAADAVFSFTAKPVRLATRLGLATVASGLIYLAYATARAVIWRDTVPGWASLIGIVLILGGAQLALVGLLGEYISRVFEEVKSRPLYLFKQSPERGPGAKLRIRHAASPQDSCGIPARSDD